MTTEIAIRDPAELDSWVRMLPPVADLAGQIHQTEFVAGALRGHPAAVTAAILAGREIGLQPMQSLQHIHIIDGRPTLSAQMQRSLALAAGYHLQIIETNSTRCVVEGRRSVHDEWTRVTWTVDDAKKAGLLGRGNWQKHPRRMLQARATAELCQLIFSDAIAGMAATEEAQDDAEGPGPELRPAVNGDAPKPRTAQRASKRPAAEATPAHPHAGEVPAPAAGPPPLPGEEDTTDYDTPGTATPEQLTALWATFTGQFEFTDSDKIQARECVEQITGRKLTGGTTKNLSRNEASLAIDTLKRCGTRARLFALMATGELPPAGEEDN